MWGIVTDTHDKFPLIEASVGLFEREGCTRVFHAGDFESNRAFGLFQKRAFQFHYVTDHDGRHDRKLSRKYQKRYLAKSIDRTRVAMYHDTYRDCERTVRGRRQAFGVAPALQGGDFDFVFYGHLHHFNVKLSGPAHPTIAVNAGGFYHEDLSTCVILDLEAGALTLYYWHEAKFIAILRLALNKPFKDLAILDRAAALSFARAYDQLQWKASDRCAHVFTAGEDEYWFNRNLAVLFAKVRYESKPAFFY